MLDARVTLFLDLPAGSSYFIRFREHLSLKDDICVYCMFYYSKIAVSFFC